MKNICLFLLLFAPEMLIAQTHGDTSYLKDAPVVINRSEEKVKEFQSYIDSLNSYEGGQLPFFLLNECFDWHTYLWEGGMHSPQSLRWSVLKAVTNKKALKAILNTDDLRLKKRCNLRYEKGYPSLAVPMIKQSTYTLLRKRFRQLK